MKPRKRERVRRELHRALERKQLVQIRRRIRAADRVEGYVVGLDDEGRWLLIAALDPSIFLDGWIAVRVRDVRRVHRRRKTEAFVRRALELHGEWPPSAPDGLELSGTRELVGSASQLFPLIVLHAEYQDPDVCFIGTPVGFRGRSMGLLEVTPRAIWEPQPTAWKLRRLSRIDLGGRYEQALSDVAGPPPEQAVTPPGGGQGSVRAVRGRSLP